MWNKLEIKDIKNNNLYLVADMEYNVDNIFLFKSFVDGDIAYFIDTSTNYALAYDDIKDRDFLFLNLKNIKWHNKFMPKNYENGNIILIRYKDDNYIGIYEIETIDNKLCFIHINDYSIYYEEDLLNDSIIFSEGIQNINYV